jgi:hypothetical protein
MSLLAAFHLVPADRLAELQSAAQPVEQVVREKVLFFTRQRKVIAYPLWDWLAAHARELEALPVAGAAVVTLETLADGQDLEEGVLGGLPGPGEALSSAMGSTFVVYDPAAARETLAVLDRLDLAPDRVRAHLVEEHGEAPDGGVEALTAARDWLRTVLAQVEPGRLGVLHMG